MNGIRPGLCQRGEVASSLTGVETVFSIEAKMLRVSYRVNQLDPMCDIKGFLGISV